MNHLKNICIALCCSLVFFTCTEETTLKTDYEPQIIIYGNLRSGTHGFGIFVAQTVPVDAYKNNPVNDAEISLFTKSPDGDTSVVLDDFTIEEGYYESKEQITPVLGNYYWIEVTLKDGSVYKSTEEKLNPIVPIESHSFIDYTLKLGISDPESESNFYLSEVAFYDEFGTIFDTFSVTSDALFNGNEDFFIEIIDVFDYDGSYSIELSSVSYNTFKFYQKLLIQLDVNSADDDAGSGGLFATPPVNLKGNIVNTSNNKTAIGNFGVLAVSKYYE